ncbi:MAG: hypothetical protein R3B09_27720 [Nannocystaceae bacterium]
MARSAALCCLFRVALVALVGCVDGAMDDATEATSDAIATTTSGSTSTTEVDTTAARETDASETDAPPGPLLVEPTDGPLALDFTASIAGQGSSRVAAIELVAGVGTVEIDGAATTIVTYERQPWGDFSLTLFQGLAVAPDRLHVLWFYCEEGALTGLYLEGTDGIPIAYEPANGTCDDLMAPSTPLVQFPAIDMPYPPITPGIAIQGPAIDLPAGDLGSLTIGGSTFTVIPFGRVDCTEECGTPGWWEVHALLWEPRAGRLCFAIVYLMLGSGDTLVTYAITLPDLSDPIGYAPLSAAWTVDGQGP